MRSKLRIVFWFLCYFEAFVSSSAAVSRNQDDSAFVDYMTSRRPENVIRTSAPNQGLGSPSDGSDAFSEIPLLDEELQLVNATKLTTTSEATWFPETGSGDGVVEKQPKSVNEDTLQISSTSEQSSSTKEGSGEWTKEIGTTTTGIPQPGGQRGKLLSQFCIQTLCNSSELKIHKNSILFAPENVNITITCEAAKSSNETHLEWYRSNGTKFLLRTGTNNKSLNLALSETTRLDSGLYICIQKNGDSCCHAEIRLHIYTIPNYKKHLIIAGGVTIGCVVVCLVLCVWRNQSLKNYKKQFKSVKCEKHQLLLP